MKKQTYILAGLALLVAIGVIIFIGTNKAAAPAPGESDKSSSTSGTPTDQRAPNTQTDGPDGSAQGSNGAVSQKITITYANDSFSPSTTTLASGGTITWVNNSDQDIQVGTDPHPSHTGNREISGDKFVLRIPAGGQATSTLTTAGKHSYHDHLNPSASGVVTVQ